MGEIMTRTSGWGIYDIKRCSTEIGFEVFPVEVSRTLTKELKGNIAQNSDDRIGT